MEFLVKEAVESYGRKERREGVEVDDNREVDVRRLGVIQDRDMKEEGQEMNQRPRDNAHHVVPVDFIPVT